MAEVSRVAGIARVQALTELRSAVAEFQGLVRQLEGFAGARQAIDLPGSDGPQQFVRLKLLGQGDEPALLPGPNVQAAAGNYLHEVIFGAPNGEEVQASCCGLVSGNRLIQSSE